MRSSAVQTKSYGGFTERDGRNLHPELVSPRAKLYGREEAFLPYAARPEYTRKVQKWVMASKSSSE